MFHIFPSSVQSLRSNKPQWKMGPFGLMINLLNMWGFPKMGLRGTPKSPILMGFSRRKYPFIGVPPWRAGNPHETAFRGDEIGYPKQALRLHPCGGERRTAEELFSGGKSGASSSIFQIVSSIFHEANIREKSDVSYKNDLHGLRLCQVKWFPSMKTAFYRICSGLCQSVL